jgi:hypothetical protein
MHDSLIRISASLGGMPDDTLDEAVAAIEQMDATLLDGDGPCAVRARQWLAARLRALSGAAGRLSDRLSLKHFSLIDCETRTVTA